MPLVLVTFQGSCHLQPPPEVQHQVAQALFLLLKFWLKSTLSLKKLLDLSQLRNPLICRLMQATTSSTSRQLQPEYRQMQQFNPSKLKPMTLTLTLVKLQPTDLTLKSKQILVTKPKELVKPK